MVSQLRKKERSAPNLDVSYIQQLEAAKLYFDAKHLDKGLKRGW